MAVENPTTKSCCGTPAELAWRALQAAEKTLNDRLEERDGDGKEQAYFAAQDAFIAAVDGTPGGVLLKLKRLADMENLDDYLEANPRLAWPRIVKNVIRDLEAADIAGLQ